MCLFLSLLSHLCSLQPLSRPVPKKSLLALFTVSSWHHLPSGTQSQLHSDSAISEVPKTPAVCPLHTECHLGLLPPPLPSPRQTDSFSLPLPAMHLLRSLTTPSATPTSPSPKRSQHRLLQDGSPSHCSACHALWLLHGLPSCPCPLKSCAA